jgi:hypothetical protein
MTRKEQIAKKAAQEAALATYKAILNPPVWKVAGTSFKTSPTWLDIAKAAAASAYGAVLKLAQEKPDMPVPDMGKAPAPWGKTPDPSKDPIFGKDVGGAMDVIKGIYNKPQPIEWFAIGNLLSSKFKPLYNWIVSGAEGELNVPTKISAKEFATWVKSNIPGKANWATAERWPEIVTAIGSNSSNPKLQEYLLSL